MAQLREVEHDEFTGVTKRWYFDGDKIVCHKTYEEDDIIQHAAQSRIATAGQTFINDSSAMHRMATLPTIVIEKILKDHGINILGDLTRNEQVRLNRIIETEYPWCKTHEKKLWRAAKKTMQDKANGNI